MNAHTHIHLVQTQTEVIDADDAPTAGPGAAPGAAPDPLIALADKLLSQTTTSIEVTAQIEEMFESGSDISVINGWVDEVVRRTKLRRKNVDPIVSRVQKAHIKAQAEAGDDAKSPVIGLDGHPDLMEHGETCLKALTDDSGDPLIYSWQGGPCEIYRPDDGGAPSVRSLSRDEFAVLLDEAAQFRGVNRDGDVIDVPASRDLVSRLYAKARQGMFPALRGLITTPCLWVIVS